MAKPTKLKLLPLGGITAFNDALVADPERTLGELLREAPAFSLETPLTEAELAISLDRLLIKPINRANLPADTPLYAPPGLLAGLTVSAEPGPAPTPSEPEPAPGRAKHDAGADPGINPSDGTPVSSSPPTIDNASAPIGHPEAGHPERITEATAVAIAYQLEIEKLATFLRSRLSLLVSCEKLVVPYLWPLIIEKTWVAEDGSNQDKKIEPVVLELPAEEENQDSQAMNQLAGGGANRLARLREIIRELKPDQVLVVPNLDLLGGGGEKGLNRESRELTELIYSARDRLVLAFVDPSLPVPEVIAARFAVRASVAGLNRAVKDRDGRENPIGSALVTAGEAKLFKNFDATELYKNISGLNPLRLREAMRYAVQVARDKNHSPENPADIGLLQQEIRAFKAQSAEQFTIPTIGFDDIGGYDEVKHILIEAIALIAGAGNLPDEKLRQELIPRGFLFHGPPGTGKTLFAKAVANRLNATVRIISGPEVTDMYVGESERKVRAIFAEARRNAPSVVVFDEFDSIAARRSGREDGGSRAGNALVAQILTEMDGFRPDVPMLVIGTTNRLGLIDEALLRPSRFQPVSIGYPDLAARRHIAHIHAQHFRIPITDELVDIVAQATRGLNGDEIRSLFRDACVGAYYRTPPEPADPRQLGFLVGRIRTRLDEQKQQSPQTRPPPRPGQRRGPSGGMVNLVAGDVPSTAE
ncbi:MAG: transitional endoplasmic reticulum ATPase [Candidatus Kentron sp. G]|nr:MAG: transitional endoplasmic reticulum ATPase [Candidatus Kentron sp. G]VFN01510.1 MAG: transitional endoplasmic reticulum ATPase [Candidatus Kentron sp. G]VFN02929.1 MAG: transitional endoplasmic reticulum ATPase [Candidatus Kentron sp. G]